MRFSRFPNSEGISPPKGFPASFSDSRLLRFPSSDGIPPSREFDSRYSLSRFVRLPISCATPLEADFTIDSKTGKVLYTHGVDITNAGGNWLSDPGYGKGTNARHYNPPVRGMVMAYKNVIIYASGRPVYYPHATCAGTKVLVVWVESESMGYAIKAKLTAP